MLISAKKEEKVGQDGGVVLKFMHLLRREPSWVTLPFTVSQVHQPHRIVLKTKGGDELCIPPWCPWRYKNVKNNHVLF